MLGQSLEHVGCETRHSKGDADVMIVETTVQSAMSCETTLACDDTDLIVLLKEKDPHYDSRLSYRCETCKQSPANTMIGLHAETMTNTMQEIITAQREMHKDMTNKFDELYTSS